MASSDPRRPSVRSMSVELDVSAKWSVVEASMQKAWDALGRIDALVNNSRIRAGDELIEIKFRLSDGTDIGPNKYHPATTVESLKEIILTQWPTMDGTQQVDAAASSSPKRALEQRMDSVENGNACTQMEMTNTNPPIPPTTDQTQQVDEASPPTQRAEDNEQRLRQPSMAEDNEILKKWGKITLWAAALSGTTLITIIAAVLQSENTIPHHMLLVSILISMCVSFTCGVLMLILWALCHGSPMRLAVFKILMLGCVVWFVIGFIIGVAFGIKRMFRI